MITSNNASTSSAISNALCGNRRTDQDGSEHRGADAFSHFVLALLIGPREVMLSSRAKHSEKQNILIKKQNKRTL